MKIAIWNVNSIKARLELVKKWLEDTQVDVLMIQELKGLEFPVPEFEALGYKVEYVGQKAYNGVATLSKHPIDVIHKALPGNDNDEQARYLEADINGLRLINIYLPNGNPVGTEKYDYKLEWMERLYKRTLELQKQDIPFTIGGDFNIIPEDKDCHDPDEWAEDALFRLESRKKFRKLENTGLYDAFRINNTSPEEYSFWDYQAGAWQKNNGIRIDHFLLSAPLADNLISCNIDTEPRGWERPSDHTPVIIELKDVS